MGKRLCAVGRLRNALVNQWIRKTKENGEQTTCEEG